MWRCRHGPGGAYTAKVVCGEHATCRLLPHATLGGNRGLPRFTHRHDMHRWEGDVVEIQMMSLDVAGAAADEAATLLSNDERLRMRR